MNPPSKDPDPLFEHVEEWRHDFDEAWFDRFAGCVMAAMISIVVMLALIIILR